MQSASLATLLLAAVCPALAQTELDLREAIPVDSFLAVHAKQNPERDFLKPYYNEIWETIDRENIPEKVLNLIQRRASGDDVEQMLEVRDTLFKAVEPIEWEKLAELNEMVYGQKMDGPFFRNVLIARFPEGGASSLVEGVTNLFNLAESASKGRLTIDQKDFEGVALTTLVLPGEVPFSPTIGVRGDLFFFGVAPDFLKTSIKLLNNPSAESKFDDSRVATALKHLPEAEDALVFLDGVTLQQQMSGIVSFIRGVGAGDEGAMRAAGLIEELFKEIRVLDHSVTVGSTDGRRLLSSSYTKTIAGAESTVLGKMVFGQKTFADWKSWVPSGASSFSLNGGVNLHPLYEWVTTKIPEMFPESKEGFEKFAAIQDQFDIHLDADFLQSFSGESISIAMPGPPTPFGASSKSVALMRCSNPDRIMSLIDRGVQKLMEIPQVQQQGIQVVDSQALDGFKEIKANMLMMMGGMTPVFGTSDGWFAMGSHADAIQTVMTTHGGEGETWASTEKFTQFGVEVGSEVQSISYQNTGESIRQFSASLQQMGAMLPMMLAMAGQQGGGANADVQELVKDLASLAAPIGRIVAKFDFIDANLAYSVAGPDDRSLLTHTVTTVRAEREGI